LQRLQQGNRIVVDLMGESEDSCAHDSRDDHKREERHGQRGISGQDLMADAEVVEAREKLSRDHADCKLSHARVPRSAVGGRRVPEFPRIHLRSLRTMRRV
jgi:hypothetical protein